MPRPLLLALVLLAGAGCGRGGDEAPPAAEAAEVAPAARPPAEAPPAPAPPATETELVEAAAAAIAARDLAALQATAAPELAADLRRLHDEDPAGFWARGQELVVNVRSGVTLAHREDDGGGRWRVLLRFGNGADEQMTFVRDGALLRIDRL